MADFSNDTKKLGYSKEEEYFFKKDRELLDRMKAEADAKRAQLEAENRKKESWMRCPKCGSNLKEERYADIVVVDRCSNSKCAGIFFDGGELEILMKAKGNLLKRIFGG